MKLHVRCIEAADLPKVDASGQCDAYCKLKVGDQVQQTRAIDNSSRPKWRQDFTFTLSDFEKDRFFLQLYDHDAIGKDDLVADLEVVTKFISPGVITDRWYDMRPIEKPNSRPRIHLVFHFAQDSDQAFVERPFTVLLCHVRVIEAQQISDEKAFVTVGFDKMKKTSIEKAPFVWQEEFDLIIPQATSILKFGLNQKGKETSSSIDISLKNNGKVHKDWYPISTGKLRLAIHISPSTVEAFAGEEYDVYPVAPRLQAYFRVIEASNLRAMDVGGTSDPFCVLSWEKQTNIKQKTRVVKKSLNPIWHQDFVFDVFGLEEDKIVVAVYDYDVAGSNDLIGKCILPITSLGNGAVVDKWISIGSGNVHLTYHLCPEGCVPFTDCSFEPKRVHVHIMDALDVPKTDSFGKSDPYVQVRLVGERNWKKTEVQDNTLTPIWSTTFNFLTHDLTKAKMEIEMHDEAVGKDPLIGSTIVDLSELKNVTQDLFLSLTPGPKQPKGGKLHFYIQVPSDGETPFKDVSFCRKVDGGQKRKKGDGFDSTSELIPFQHGVSLYILVQNAQNLPKSDSVGTIDPYCILKFGQEKLRTSIVSDCLNPNWSEYFRFNVKSLSDATLDIDVFDSDRLSRDDKIGSVGTIFIRDLVTGSINSKQLSLEGTQGLLNLQIHLGRSIDRPFVPQNWAPLVIFVRLLSIESFPAGPKYVKLGCEYDIAKPSKVRDTGVYKEDFQFFVTDKSFGLKAVIISQSKKEKELASILIPVDFPVGQIVDKTFDGKLHLLINVEEYGRPSRLPYLQPEGYIGQTMTLNVHVIEARDLPAMDSNGFSDPYILLNMKGRKDKRIKTKVVKKTLTPTWNEEYHFPIQSIGTDTLHLSMKDWDAVGKDDKISTFDIPVSSLTPGRIIDQWYTLKVCKGASKPGQVHLQLHLADKGQVAFYEQPFHPLVCHVMIIEAKDLPKMDVGGLSDPYCRVSLAGDVEFQQTTVKDVTLSPQWFETFHFMMTSYEQDILHILMRDKDKLKDDDMGICDLKMADFEIGSIYKRWFPLQMKGKPRGQIRLQIHIAQQHVSEWQGNIIPDAPLPPSDKMELQIHLHQATNIPASDSNGYSDPYCICSILGTKLQVKSRRIDRTLNPAWDDQLRIPITSLNTDVLRIEIVDWDKVGKDDKLSFVDIPLCGVQPGVVNYQPSLKLTPMGDYTRGGQLQVTYQITVPGQVPYQSIPFMPYQLNVRVDKVTGLKSKAKKNDIFCALKLKNDSKERMSSITENQLDNQFCEDFNFILVDPQTDVFCFAVKNRADKDSVLGSCEFQTKNLTPSVTQELDLVLNEGGRVHLFMQIERKDIIPFADAQLCNMTNPNITLYVKVLDAQNVPSMDSGGLADPYLTIDLEGRKGSQKKTEIQFKTLTPVFNQEFQFKKISYGTDKLCVTMFDYDKCSRNDKIGSWTCNIQTMQPGVIYDEVITLTGNQGKNPTLHIIRHLAGPNLPKFVNIPFDPPVLYVRACEAWDIASVDGPGSKSDPYLELKFAGDAFPQKTGVVNDSLTPQWFQDFKFYVSDPSEEFQIMMKDDGVMRDTKMASLQLKLDQLQPGVVYDNLYDLTPEKGVKTGGKLRLFLQYTNSATNPFDGPRDPKPLPEPKPEMRLNIHLIEADGLQAMDTSGSDCYCIFTIPGRSDFEPIKSRIIDNTTKPKWNQYFSIPILSLNTDMIRLTVMDYDKMSKDDPISFFDFNLQKLKFGIVVEEWLQMSPLFGVSKPGPCLVKYQITAPNQQPFVDQPFTPETVFVHIADLEKTPADYFCQVSLLADARKKYTKVTDSQIHEGFFFYLTDLSKDSLCIDLMQNVDDGKHTFAKEQGRVILPLTTYQTDKIYEETKEGVHYFLHFGQVPFQPPVFQERLYQTRYAHFEIIEAADLPKMDSGKQGKVDSYVKVNIKKKRFNAQTRVWPQEFAPQYRQTFHVPIQSFDQDIVKIKVFDWDKVSKDDLIGAIHFKASEMGNGKITDKWYKLNKGGRIHIRSQVCDINSVPFIEQSFVPDKVNVYLIECQDTSCFVNEALDPIRQSYIKMEHDLDATHSAGVGSFPPQFDHKCSMLFNPGDQIQIELGENLPIWKVKKVVKIPLNEFQKDLIYDRIIDGLHLWIEITSSLNTKIFESKFEPPIPKAVSSKHQLYFKIKKVFGVTNVQADLYATIEIDGIKPNKTRTIKDIINPYFNDEFLFDLPSLNDAKHCWVKIWNDVIGKDLCVAKAWIDLTDAYGVLKKTKLEANQGGTIEVEYQIVNIGQQALIDQPFKPQCLQLYLGGFQTPVQQTLFWRIKLAHDFNSKMSSTQINGEWNETFEFLLTDETEMIEFELNGVQDDQKKTGKEKVIAKQCCMISKLTQMNFDGFGDLFISYQPPQQAVSPYKPVDFMALHIFIDKAEGLSSSDVNGLSDPYVRIRMKPKRDQICTRFVPKTLNPVWKQYVFQKVKSLATDQLHVSVFDYDVVTKNDKIGKVKIDISGLPCGQVVDKWYNLAGGAGRIHLILHLAAPNSIPFIDSPFYPENVNIRIIEGIGLAKGDLYTRVKVSGDISWQKTRAIDNTDCPQWYSTFSLPFISHADSIIFELMDDDICKDHSYGTAEFVIANLEPGITKPIELPIGKGRIKLLLQTSTPGFSPFYDYQEPDPKISSDKVMLHVKVVEARNLPKVDAGSGSCDAYCTLTVQETFKTRTITNSQSPKWGENFHILVPSFETDSFVLKLFDYDKLSKDDLIGQIVIPIQQMQCGIVVDQWHNLGRGEIHLVTHLAAPGQISFEQMPFIPMKLSAQISGGQNFTFTCPVLRFRMENDKYWQYTKAGPPFICDASFLVIPDGRKLELSCLDFDKKSVSDPVLIELNKSDTISINGGLVTVTSYLTQQNEFPIQPHPIQMSHKYTLNIAPIEITNLDNKPNQWYLTYSFEGRTSIHGRSTLTDTGKWNDYDQFELLSLGSDILKITIWKRSQNKKDKEEGVLLMPIKQMQFGVVIDDYFKPQWSKKSKSNQLHLRLHVCAPNSPAFVSNPFTPYVLHFLAIEAVDIPKMDLGSKSDPFVSIKLSSDVLWTNTKALEDTLTPQWDENLDLIITSPDDELLIRIMDKNTLNDKEISNYKVDLKSLQIGIPNIEWYKMIPAKGVKKGGFLNSALLVSAYGSPGINVDDLPYSPLPSFT